MEENAQNTQINTKKSPSSMQKRLLTGTVYVIVMAGLLLAKLLIPATTGFEYGALGIDILFMLISVIGAHEFLRAVNKVSTAQKWAATIFCTLLIPAYTASKIISAAANVDDYSLLVSLCVGGAGAITVASLGVFNYENSNITSTALAQLCILYCGVLTCLISAINHIKNNSAPAILLLFLIVPFVDTCAFFFGKMLGKTFPKKMAPTVSPNKTVIGGIGGLIGGLVAGVLVWVLCEYTSVEFYYGGKLPSVVVFLLISLPTAAIAQLGDLFESAIKRGCGIKDMGNILPGHGGVLDRFDSMLFAAVPVLISFVIL